MSHRPERRVCQGNFAASVKEILPINEYGVLAISGLDWSIFPANCRGFAAVAP